MKLLISQWGNSLALRLPAELVRQLGFKPGDHVQGSLTIDGGLSIRPKKWDRAAFAAELAAAQKQMAMGESVVEEMRRGARY